MSVLSFFIPLYLFSFFYVPIFGETKFVAAGHIFCTTTGRGSKEPVNEARVVLMEADDGNLLDVEIGFGHLPNLDDFMGGTYSNAKGEFRVTGSTGELGEEELYLWILHRCPKDASELPPENLKYIVRIDLDKVLSENGKTEVNDLEIYLGENSAKSGSTNLPMTPIILKNIPKKENEITFYNLTLLNPTIFIMAINLASIKLKKKINFFMSLIILFSY